MSPMIIAVLIFLLTLGWLVSETTAPYVVVLCGSAALLALRVLTFHEAVQYVNWQTLFLLLGMLILVEGLAEFGFFEWLARRLSGRGQTAGRHLYMALPLLAGALSTV